jgi:tetratricopeptide (TPR) repeat protein
MPVGPARVAALLLALLVSVSASAPVFAQKKLSQKDINKMTAEADKAAAEGRLEDARQTLNTLIERDPTQASAAFRLMGICQKLNQPDCVGTAAQIATGSPQPREKAEAHAVLAEGHLRSGRYDDAAEHARTALGHEPSLVGAKMTLAASLIHKNDPGALAAAQQAVEASPDNGRAHAMLGTARVRAGQSAEAETAFRRAVELDPKAADAHAGLAELQFARGDHPATIASVTSALDADGSLTHLYSLRGRSLAVTGDAAAAEADLQRAVSARSQDAAAHLTLGDLYLKQNKLDSASIHYRRVVSVDPQSGPGQLGVAETMVAYRQTDAANEAIESAIRLMPESAKAHYLLGVVRESQKRYDEALAAFERAVALDAQMGPAYHGAGRILREQKKDTAGSLTRLEKAAALAPEEPAVLTDFAVSLYDAKQGEKAIPLLQKAVATPDYKNPMGLTVLGLALKDKGSYADALGYFERGSELAPKWWLPHWGAAWSYFAMFKKGCPCGAEDDARVKKMKAHYDQMTSLDGKDAGLQTRVQALVDGQKIR